MRKIVFYDVLERELKTFKELRDGTRLEQDGIGRGMMQIFDGISTEVLVYEQ